MRRVYARASFCALSCYCLSIISVDEVLRARVCGTRQLSADRSLSIDVLLLIPLASVCVCATRAYVVNGLRDERLDQPCSNCSSARLPSRFFDDASECGATGRIIAASRRDDEQNKRNSEKINICDSSCSRIDSCRTNEHGRCLSSLPDHWTRTRCFLPDWRLRISADGCPFDCRHLRVH